jgi:acetaldehyde dehydrogenase/alcohol dehydrogenase
MVEQALVTMRRAQPDTVIALGGGSVMDAAKIIRLFYDYPELKLSEIAVNFLDFRHRMVEFPQQMHTQLVAIPTTSGTGSEVTPFAVLKDKENNRKLSLIDECMMPNWAIIDANLTKSLPKNITVDTAFDALTHALESLVSTFASDYTDGLALESMRLIFEALPQALKNPNNIVWRHKLHNASTLAGMAIGNASVGINHALAHSLGAVFDVPHGRANGVFLLSTLEYNSCIPRKFMPTSTYSIWVADQKYARAAQFLGLTDEGPTESNGHLSAREKEDARCKRMNTLLRRAVYDLAKACDQPTSICELGISEEAFETALPSLIKSSYTDMSLRTNPSLPLLSEVQLLMISAYPLRERP